MHTSRPDILMLQESTQDIVDCIAATLLSHQYIKDFSSHKGWGCESNIFYDNTLFKEVEHGVCSLDMADYPNRGLFWLRLRVRAHPDRTIFFCTCHMPWPGCAAEVSSGVNQRLLCT